jgi:hypothetical protein
MMSRDNAIQGAARSARRFIADNAAALTSVDLTGACKQLDEVITNFATHAYNQDAHNRSAKGETEKQGQVRLKLRKELMAPIAEIARRNLSTVPEFKALQLPPRSAKGERFLASAKAMVDAASKYKDALLERGLPGDSLDQFQALLTTFTSSVADSQADPEPAHGCHERPRDRGEGSPEHAQGARCAGDEGADDHRADHPGHSRRGSGEQHAGIADRSCCLTTN